MDPLREAAGYLVRSLRSVALTGAGVSTESGLPDFRSDSGLWAGVDPMEVASLTAFRRHPEAFYHFYRTRLAQLGDAQPNPAHFALAALEMYGLAAVITQNVDGLHQAAGSQRVIELHGNLREAACLSCGWRGPITLITDAVDRGELPVCPICGSRPKPNVVLFEELLPADAYQAAEREVQSAQALLVVGTSLQVTPAAYLPEVARAHGAAIVIVNDGPTAMDNLADVVVRGRAGSVLPQLVAAIAGAGQREHSS
jgi:NAD-dependent deacetylase